HTSALWRQQLRKQSSTCSYLYNTCHVKAGVGADSHISILNSPPFWEGEGDEEWMEYVRGCSQTTHPNKLWTVPVDRVLDVLIWAPKKNSKVSNESHQVLD